MTTRVAVYVRYSSGLQKPTSIEDQIAMAEIVCKQNGWTIVETFIDMEKTGRNTNRAGYQAMKAAAQSRRFDMVVTESMSRLNRNVRDSIDIYTVLSFQDVSLYTIEEKHQDFLRVLFLGYGSQTQSEKIGEATLRGMKGALKRKRLHGKAFGYRKRKAEHGCNREIVEEQAAVVRRIFKAFASGQSATAIAESLNADRIPAPKGGSWEGSTIRGNPARGEGILRNRLYIGIPGMGRTKHTYNPETFQKRIKPTPDQMVEEDIPELRIIDQPLWDAVQAELARRAAASPKAARAARRKTYLLSGLLTCGCCGGSYITVNKTSYGCREARRKGCSNKVLISRKRIETRVFAALDQAFRSPELIAQFEAAMESERKALADGSLDTERARLGAALKKAEQGKTNILNAIAEGAPYATFKEKAEALEVEIAQLTQRVSDIDTQIENSSQVMESGAAVYERVLSQLTQLLSDRDFVEEAHGYLAVLIRKIVLMPDETAEHGLRATMELSSEALLPGVMGDQGAGSKSGTKVVC
ncbi:Site-specific DNA recombinase [Roseivivax halotolerans]|uniref:Site-specific DNA recombinase n=1 Tax=Roseivivax halotolerans TaxID=93684 RepID=A0A1I5YJN8_9RHOB|nr:recombinase family protein [Roseivivax halotolerans]SFQ44446.1 Site-specific DNA recombinase [Roseivivax halotolerans]